jgi:ABC-type lipoprotein release transport system permease subunit
MLLTATGSCGWKMAGLPGIRFSIAYALRTFGSVHRAPDTRVVRDGMFLALIGVALGLAGAFAMTRLLASLLFGITPTDAFTFSMVTLGLLLVTLMACLIPARRATIVDPSMALIRVALRSR